MARTASSAEASRATSPSRAGAPGSNAAWLARARPSSEAPRPARSAASEAARSAASREGPENRRSWAGSGRRRAARWGPWYSSTVTWALVPPKPKADSPARRGWSAPEIHGRATVLGCTGQPSAASASLGAPTLIVGGSTPWRSAVTTLRSDTAPAEVLGCPMSDFTEPSAARRVRPGPPNTRVIERTSVASPSSVPVPWASISPTVSGP